MRSLGNALPAFGTMLSAGAGLGALATAAPPLPTTTGPAPATPTPDLNAPFHGGTVKVVTRSGATIPVQVPSGIAPTQFVSMVEKMMQHSCPDCSVLMQQPPATDPSPAAATASSLVSAACFWRLVLHICC